MCTDRNQSGSETPWTCDIAEIVAHCCEFISTTVAAAKTTGVVVGLSGGIDSAVSAALATRALGVDQVLGVFMPYKSSLPASLDDAKSVATKLGIATELVPISSVVDAYLSQQSIDDRHRSGNVMARTRMMILYDLSAREGRLVLGTGNRTECLLGYTTLFGDSACALNPLGQLYKTEVNLLASYLELPETVRTKQPSADLWEGQTDEDELGFTYAEADRLLLHMIDEQLAEKQLISLGFSKNLVDTISKRVVQMRFKRVPVPVADFPGRQDPDWEGGDQ